LNTSFTLIVKEMWGNGQKTRFWQDCIIDYIASALTRAFVWQMLLSGDGEDFNLEECFGVALLTCGTV
jgi:hypothetical protein